MKWIYAKERNTVHASPISPHKRMSVKGSCAASDKRKN
jgi:hypothetical protein